MTHKKSIIRAFIRETSDEDADLILANAARDAMLKKLKKKRDEGYGGWHDDCFNGELWDRLKEHVEKGDPVDVMNFAAMIYVREKLYGGQA